MSTFLKMSHCWKSHDTAQLLHVYISNNFSFQVILGGGRRSFIPKDEMDPETGDNSDQGRLDGRNLINVSLGGSRAGEIRGPDTPGNLPYNIIY